MATLKQINSRAKAIRKNHPKMEWKTAQRRAADELRKPAKKVGARSTTRKGKSKYKVTHVVHKVGAWKEVRHAEGVLRTAEKKALESLMQIQGFLLAELRHADSAAMKKDLKKQLKETDAEINRLKKLK